MISLIAILFPLILLVFIYRYFWIIREPLFRLSEISEIDASKLRGCRQDIGFKYKSIYLVVSIITGMGIGLLQYGLFRISVIYRTGYLFESRMSDSLGYSLMTGLILGFPLAIIICTIFMRMLGKERFAALLSRKHGGIEVKKWFSWIGNICISTCVFVFVLNLIAYNTYLVVTEEQISYRRWRSFPATSTGINQIDHLRSFSIIDITDTGRIERKFLQVIFKDGKILNTVYLVSAARTKELVEVLKSVHDYNLEIKKV
ncbi:MAG: hypothetical protein OXI88_12435 [Gammaproteobacteria bacterium]|nr:hypothetical protein [Gammaproteobacteria bacterium]MDE0512582.1 hypothetical protein [Gammaproteobacteria bacterium]